MLRSGNSTRLEQGYLQHVKFSTAADDGALYGCTRRKCLKKSRISKWLKSDGVVDVLLGQDVVIGKRKGWSLGTTLMDFLPMLEQFEVRMPTAPAQRGSEATALRLIRRLAVRAVKSADYCTSLLLLSLINASQDSDFVQYTRAWQAVLRDWTTGLSEWLN